MKSRSVATIVWLIMLAGSMLPPECSAQAIPGRDRWGEKYNSPGAKITYKEIARTRIQDGTLITYNLFASGLPKDGHYVMCVLNVGSDPRAATDAYLNGEGKVVNILADPSHHTAEDPIDLKVLGGKGEPIQVALISDDGNSRAFAEIVPFPIEETSGPCHLTAIETGPYYVGMSVKITGLQPNEGLLVDTNSENERAQTKAKADDQGSYNVALFPFVKGKRSGKARLYVTAKSCKIGVEFPWGEGSFRYQ
jgi:hypothetical protein